MTLNQIIKRVQTIALAHKQVNSFFHGAHQDFLEQKKRDYPAMLLQDSGGNISLDNHQARFDFRIFLFDLSHMAADTKANELDVQSDMISVAMDILAQLNNANYDDWRVSSENSMTLIVEDTEDNCAGCFIDVSINVIYTQNRCAVPTDLLPDFSDDPHIVLADYSKGFVLETADGYKGMVTLVRDPVTTEFSITLTPL